MATVLSCHYEFGAGQALAFGIPRSRHFRIAFNYWAEGELHMGEFLSSKAIPQGELFPITYDPSAPHQNNMSGSTPVPLRLLGVIASALLITGLTSVFFVRGCSPGR